MVAISTLRSAGGLIAVSSHDRATKEGVFAGLLAYTLWGLFPIYFKLVGDVAITEVLAHRIIWALPFGALIILFRKQWSDVYCALTNRVMLFWLGLAALAIAVNWLIYIWAVQNERIFEASLGYYINPMLYVLVGVVFFAERLRILQIIAVVLATVGVIVLSVSHGQVPWASLALATLFTTYGVIRKQIAIGAMPGLFVETLLLFPFAMTWLLMLLSTGEATFSNSGAPMDGLLTLAGPVTVLPLLFFAIAARRLTLTTIGFMQFVGPTLQFFTALYYGEVLTTAHKICFSLIWIAAGFFVFDALKSAKKKPLLNASTEA